MTWMLMDEGGNAIAAYADVVAARAGLRALVGDDPDARGSVLLLEYDETGEPVGEAIAFDDLPETTVTLEEATFDLIFEFRTTFGFSGGVREPTVILASPLGVATQGAIAAPAA